ncbi:MAG: MoaD/ThiS family protein [Pirellulales bacterium]
MPHIEFTSQLSQHLECSIGAIEATTLREAFDVVFERNPKVRSYLLDDQGAVRKHVAVFINNQLLHQRNNLEIALPPDAEIYVMQALSGG